MACTPKRPATAIATPRLPSSPVHGSAAFKMKTRERAKRVSSVLNEFVWALTTSYITIMVWKKYERDFSSESVMVRAVRHGILMSLSTICVTLRQFEDLWTHHLQDLLSKESESHVHARWILEQCRSRSLRRTTNLFFAHYAAGKTEWPLPGKEMMALLFSGNWESDEQLCAWAQDVAERLSIIRDGIDRHSAPD
jgi:hypothetical protein